MTPETSQKIEEQIRGSKVFLYMKGTPQFPQCGFSAQVCNLLNTLDVSYGSCNILEDEDIRQAIKEYSNWPTIPQLYVDGKFVGGCDILTELHERGELAQVVGASSPAGGAGQP